MANNGPFEVGFGRPPRSTRFKPGQSGNPNGRPRGAKNFAIAIGQELVARVVHSAGYNLLSFTRAFAVLNCQSALVCFLLRSVSHASTSCFSTR